MNLVDTLSDTAPDALWLAAAYLSGSLPMGLWVGRSRGVDLRTVGSGNLGATNAGRVLGRRFFFVVFVLDFLKSCGPVRFACLFAPEVGLEPERLGLACGVAAILGHMFPLYLRFKGGKGVATAAGVFFALAPWPAAAALLVWLLLFATSRYVSLASIGAAIVLPIACAFLPRLRFFGPAVDRATLVAAIVVGILIVVRHKSNIGRLLRGEELRAGGGAR